MTKKQKEDTIWVGCTASLKGGRWAQHPWHSMKSPLSGSCWGGSSVGVSSSASVACACRWWLQPRRGGKETVSREEKGPSTDSPQPSCVHRSPALWMVGLGTQPKAAPSLLPWVGFFFSSLNFLRLREETSHSPGYQFSYFFSGNSDSPLRWGPICLD